MAEINKALYQEIILEHNKTPHHFGEMKGYTHLQVGNNASCGDKLVLYVKIDDLHINDISFIGEGCAIFKSSCSMLTDAVYGKSKEDALEVISQFQDMILSREALSESTSKFLGKLAIFSSIKQYPARVKCALLGVRTLQSILEENPQETISTES